MSYKIYCVSIVILLSGLVLNLEIKFKKQDFKGSACLLDTTTIMWKQQIASRSNSVDSWCSFIDEENLHETQSDFVLAQLPRQLDRVWKSCPPTLEKGRRERKSET